MNTVSNKAIDWLIHKAKSEQAWLLIHDNTIIKARDALYAAIDQRDRSEEMVEDIYETLESLGRATKTEGGWVTTDA